jgi:hypothetical protein
MTALRGRSEMELRITICALVLTCLLSLPFTCLGQGFSDDFESYTPNEDLPAPWADWGSGQSPSTGNQAVYWTLYDAYGNNGSLQYLVMEGEPVRWFDNPYDAKDRIVDITFYVRTQSENGFDFFAGSMGWTPSGGQGEQYGVNVGSLHISPSMNWCTGMIDYYDVRYAGNHWTTNFVGDGETWNEIKIHTVVRNVNTMMGEGELYVNGVATGGTHIWNLNDEYGLSGVDFYGWDWNREYHIDDISILQNGFADPIDIPTPDYSYPGNTITNPGIESDGVQYVYMLGGANTAATGSSELWRLDVTTGTWTQLTSSPTVPHPTNPSAVITHQTSRVALTTAGDQGKISVAKHLQLAGQASPWCIDYDIALGTWSSPINPTTTPSSWDVFQHVTAAETRIYSPGNPSQAGMLIYDSETREFLGWQGAGNTFPYQMIGNDLAYADDGNNWLYGLGHRWRGEDDAPMTIGRYDITQATPGAWDQTSPGVWWYSDAPVACPNPRVGISYPAGHHGLTYVPEGINHLIVLHTVWGETGLYKIPVEGGALFAVVYQNDDIFRYDIDTDTWTTMTDALPFEFDLQDDVTFAVPLPDDPVLYISDYDASNVELSWETLDVFKYRLWESDDMVTWDVSEDWQNGTGAWMSVFKSKTGVTKKFYKLERESI